LSVGLAAEFMFIFRSKDPAFWIWLCIGSA
jgi:hypothetical protein